MNSSKKKDIVMFVFLFIVTILTIFFAIILFYKSFQNGEEVVLYYNENSSLNYRVHLQENEFYKDEYVGEDYDLVSTSIDELEIDFDYVLNTSEFVKGVSYYTINSKIVAYQKDDDAKRKVWDYEKLIKDKTITLYDINSTNVIAQDSFKIDYKEYKELMDNYKKKYAVSLVGNLILEIEIKSDLTYDKFSKGIDLDLRKMSLVIPLTEPVVKITKTLIPNETKFLIEKADSKINYLKLVISIFCFILDIAICIYIARILVKLLGYDTKYEKDLNKILKTYNSIIVNVKDMQLEKGEKKIMVSSFEELLDAQSELRVPILYCNIRQNKESAFYIKYGNDILVYELKSDLYKDNIKSKDIRESYEEQV